MGLVQRASSRHSQRGVGAIDAVILFAAAMVVGSIITVTLLGVGRRAADNSGAVAERGLAEAAGAVSVRGGVLTVRGDVDVDGDNVINLSGNDRQAVVKISFVVAAPESGIAVDLTPPYTTNATGTDPDASGLSYSTLVGFNSRDFQMASGAWTVSFPGTDNGDYILDPSERAEVTLWLHPYDGANGHYDMGTGQGGPFVDTSSGLLLANTPFTVEVVVKWSGALQIQRVTALELGSSDMLE